jgi:hypothetical protein
MLDPFKKIRMLYEKFKEEYLIEFNPYQTDECELALFDSDEDD